MGGILSFLVARGFKYHPDTLASRAVHGLDCHGLRALGDLASRQQRHQDIALRAATVTSCLHQALDHAQSIGPAFGRGVFVICAVNGVGHQQQNPRRGNVVAVAVVFEQW